ncbi:MAG: DUF3667 domain-containing protein [Flavobacteriales bacterium]|nr:DUF3667 domain-containing protein [Flavobacteriales bacterium]
MAMQHHTHCLNCEAPLRENDRFCPNCGQEDRELEIRFTELVKEFLSSNFNFDTKLGYTIRDLLLKPGEITRQFLAGKRVRYVKPLQLYFFISFVYFLLLGISTETSPNDSYNPKVHLNEVKDRSSVENQPAIVSTDNPSALDSLAKVYDADASPWKKHLVTQAKKSLNPEFEERFTNELFSNFSISMFLLLPVFALIVWLFSKRESPYFMNSVIFSIHFHCVAFLLFSLDMIIGFFADHLATTLVFFVLIPIYLVLAMKRVFDLSWLRSITRTFGVFVVYLFFFAVSIIGILAVSVWNY